MVKLSGKPACDAVAKELAALAEKQAALQPRPNKKEKKAAAAAATASAPAQSAAKPSASLVPNSLQWPETENLAIALCDQVETYLNLLDVSASEVSVHRRKLEELLHQAMITATVKLESSLQADCLRWQHERSPSDTVGRWMTSSCS